MVNSDDFNKRLEIILEYYGLTAASFADQIGVQRSSLSHLLSGRNKPSLDFVLKLIVVFPEVDLYWILLGNGNFPKQEMVVDKSNHTKTLPSPTDTSTVLSNEKTVMTLKQDKKKPALQTVSEEQVEQLILIYADGSFKTLRPKDGLLGLPL